MRKVLLWLAGLFALGVSALLEVTFHDASHAELVWHRYPVFDFVFGAIGCALIVVISKWLGHHFLQRDESYYEVDRETETNR